ncbi:hypothetical protein [Nocardia arthritidis]|uniref:PIN domain-containing protein n=1 Tax=Nocardia arthritidis TaxID=228602 RepID=A0A6G9YKE7_9NOCA|nr:hypothetical protein [Nocardia arthritidis]QIS13661.1 hypothetical protein F5544_29080 [Nocardia arthritidis]
MSGIVFDTAAVLGWIHNHPYPQGIYWSFVEHGGIVVIPAAVLAAAEATERNRDALAVLLDAPHTLVSVLDRAAAADLGALLRRRVHSDQADMLITAAHAITEATSRGWYVLTDRAELLTQIDPKVLFDTLP